MKLFISHSTRDIGIVVPLIDLLRSALSLRASDIRCTSVDGYRLPAGARTDDQLRAEVVASDAFIGVLSPASDDSMYVAFELGARWGARKQLIPLLVRGALTGLLTGPLRALNAIAADSDAQLHQLVDDLANILNVSAESPAAYAKHVTAVVQAAKAGDAGANTMLNASQTFTPEPEDSWPHTRTYDTLRMALRRLSETNKNIIRVVAGHQIYAGEVAAAVSLKRDELIYRCEELETQQLLHVDNLTDKRYELHTALPSLLGDSAAQVVVAMMA